MYPHPTLKNRVIKSFAPAVRPPPRAWTTRNEKYKLYSEESVEKALDEIEAGMSIRRAADAYNVPRSTLSDLVTGKTSIGARSGCAILSHEEEKELCTFLVEAAKIGYPRTCQQAIAIVQQIADKKNLNSTITKGWWQSYCARFPQLALKSAVPLTKARHRATDQTVLDKYYDILYESLSENEILNEPGAIYNCDETGLPINPACHKVVSIVGSKNPFTITDGTKGQYTVLACTCATGTTIPPYIVLNRKSLGCDFTKGEVPGTLYGLSTNGWMTQDLFHQWFVKHFLRYATSQRPIILLMDGHSSHYCPATITLAAEHKVILFALPPNTTHLTQPLDRACFAPLKNAWREVHHIFLTNNPGRRVTHNDFSTLFAQAWFKSMTMANITAGFRVTGIFPFQRMSLEAPSTSYATLAERTGLAYIPLFSPARSSQPLDRTPKSGIACSNLKKSTPIIQAKVSMRTATSISKILEQHKPMSTKTSQPTKPCKKETSGCVLTSKENLQALKLKQEVKATQEAQKEERQRIREDKAKTKVIAKKQQFIHQCDVALWMSENPKQSKNPKQSIARKISENPKKSTAIKRKLSESPKQSTSSARKISESLKKSTAIKGKLSESPKQSNVRKLCESLKKSTAKKLSETTKQSNATNLKEKPKQSTARKLSESPKQSNIKKPSTAIQNKAPKDNLKVDKKPKLSHVKSPSCTGETVISRQVWWLKNLHLRVEDRTILEEGKDLNDTIINAAQTLLKTQYPNIGGFQNTLLGQRLQFKEQDPGVQSVQILHTGESHWVLVHRTAAQTIQVIDTLAAKPCLTDHTLLQIAAMYKPPTNSLSIDLVSVQQQKGVHDCGVFAIAFMVEICKGKGTPSGSMFSQKMMRHHLKICLEKGNISEFPKAICRRGIQFSKSAAVTEELYCICRMPDVYGDRMIACDSCAKWFHCKCVRVTKRITKATWKCPSCS